MRILPKLFAISALLLLSACLLVDDFGDTWSEAKPDYCLTKLAESLYYAEFNRDPAEQDKDAIARGLTLDGQHFLLLKKNANDKGGRLYRFRVEHGIFVRYRLAPTMRDAFEAEYPNAPVSLKRDTVTIATLNVETKKLLVDVARKPEYWEVEDKTFYNVLRNPTCRFDDRDLTKDEDGKPRKNHDQKR